MKPFKRSLAALAIAVLSVTGGFFGYETIQNVQFAHAEQKIEATREQLAQVEDLAHVFRQVGKVVEPSVVNIEMKKTVKGGNPLPFDDETLKRFFPDRDGDGQPDLPPGFENGGEGDMEQMGTGSGVIMEADPDKGIGYILTNNHVVGDATELTITLADKRQITNAKVVGTDPKSDLAVVRIEADRLSPAKWGDSDQLEKGDWIMAFGSPFGYIGSMTHGIVSALNRDVGILRDKMGYENFIQVDAPINPGNSGGPLVNIRGEVVGINTAIFSRTGGFQGIGFAIPSNQAKLIYGQLKDKGKVTRGWLGVSIGNVRDPAAQPVAKSFGYDKEQGVLIQQTFPNTPADGKLQEGDIITAINGTAVDDVSHLRNIVASIAPGTEAKFSVFRDHKDVEVPITIGEQPDDLMAAAGRPEKGGEGVAPKSDTAETLGMKLSTANEALIKEFELGNAKGGALVTEVERGSVAAKAGLRAGDLITRVDREPIKTAKDFADAVKGADATKGVRLYVMSRDGSRFVFLKLEK